MNTSRADSDHDGLRLLRIILISALGFAAGVGALTLYPPDVALETPSNITDIGFTSDEPITFGMDASSLTVDLSRTAGGGTRITTYTPPTQNSVTVTTKSGATAEQSSTAGGSGHGPMLVASFSIPASARSGGFVAESSSGGEYASLELPLITVLDDQWTYTGTNPAAGLPVLVVVHFPGWQSYTWSGGPIPRQFSTPDEMSFVVVTDAIGDIEPISESGVSATVEHADATKILIVGGLVGVSGAALIALVQEIKRKRPGRE